ncbi:MAG: sensor histidine kinase [Bacteroidota bacterium]|nr:sensor histidine kinase [Bacteroidota bacterium]
MKNFFLAFLICFISCEIAPAQNSPLVDSLQKILPGVHDTIKLKILSDLSWELRNADKKKALEYAQQELSIATKLKNPKAIAQGHNDIGITYYQFGKLKEALASYEQSLAIRKTLNDKSLIASSLNKIALVHHDMGNYPKALEMQLSIIEIYKELNIPQNIAFTYNNIGELYNQQNDYDQALAYWEKALVINQQTGDKYAMGGSYSGMGVLFEKQKKYDKAIEYLTKGAQLFLEIGDYDDYSSCINNVGMIYRSQGNTKKGLDAYLSALEMALKYEDSHGVAKYSCNIGVVYTDLGNFALAESYLMKGLEIAKTNNIRSVERQAYKSLTTLFIKSKDPKAMEYYQKYDALKDSIFSEESTKQIAEMQTKYDSEKKEQENQLLSKDNDVKEALIKQQTTQRNLLIFSLGAIILVSLLLYNRYKLKQKELFQKELIRQQELRSKAIIEAEEKERMRIAQELHDGVGQQLSAVKLNMSSLESSLDLQNDEQRLMMKNALEIIDDSVKEVRSVSHSMMPNALIKSGLATAVREFLNRISHTDKLKIELEIDGLNERLEPTAETVLFRVLQEIVNNIIKHSEASIVNIQLIRHEDELTLMVEDNGKGFDINRVSGGIGLKNIQSRVEYLNGSVHFDSHPGKGTTVSIEIPLK